MTLKNYLSIMGALTAICLAMLLFVGRLIDPQSTSWIGFCLFYSAVFMVVAGLTSLLGFWVRFKLLKHELAFKAVKLAFKQSFIFALFVVALLIMSSRGWFSWLNLLLLVVIFTIWEFFTGSQKNN